MKQLLSAVWQRLFGLAKAALGSLLLASCAIAGGTVDVEGTAADVQQGTEGSNYDLITSQSSLAQVQATAAVRHFESFRAGDGTVLENATCGVTFLSPHFAVTAAHCVTPCSATIATGCFQAGYYNAAGEFYLQEIDASGVNPSDVQTNGQVWTANGWPNWDTGSSFDEPTGYTRVESICRPYCLGSSCFGGTLPAGSYTSDMAIIECPDRNGTEYVAVATTDPGVGQQVDVWWYHEYLDLPYEPDASQEWAHYGAHTPNAEDNFHYTFPHLLMPMRSRTNEVGAPATFTNVSSNPLIDAFGCHGTSGSGVFARGSTYVYGPVLTSTRQTKLCDFYMHPLWRGDTSALANLTVLHDDRNGTYTPSF